MKKIKIGIIGIGNVGSHVLYTCALQGLGDEYVLIDINGKKAAADRQDVFDSAMFLPHPIRIRVADAAKGADDPDGFGALKDCDIIINSVGQIDLLRGEHDRFVELRFNIPAVRSYAAKIAASGFDGILVNISNPCDVITHELIRLVPLKKGRIFGTGTGLDTARLKAALADRLKLEPGSITAFMFGEHGSHQITPWSLVNFNGIGLEAWAKKDERFRFDKDSVEHAAAEGGWVTFNGKFHTEFAISLTAARIIKAVIYDEKAILPASVLLEGEYGEQGVCAGVPAVIGAAGIEAVPEYPITDEERARFHACCDHIRANIAEAAKL